MDMSSYSQFALGGVISIAVSVSVYLSSRISEKPHVQLNKIFCTCY